MNLRMYFIFLEVESLIYILPLTVYVYLHSIFSGGHRKTFLSLFGANRKCVSAVHGHSRSINLAPIESAYATSY